MSEARASVSTRMVFWSAPFAVVTAVLLAAAVAAIAVAGAIGAVGAVAPLIGAYVVSRRARVTVELDGRDLKILPGIGPRRCLALAPAEREAEGAPFRLAGAVPQTHRAELGLVDPELIDGPLMTSNPEPEPFGPIFRTVLLLGRFLTPGHPSPKVELMGRITIRTPGGPTHFTVPAAGNHAQLKALLTHLNQS